MFNLGQCTRERLANHRLSDTGHTILAKEYITACSMPPIDSNECAKTLLSGNPAEDRNVSWYALQVPRGWDASSVPEGNARASERLDIGVQGIAVDWKHRTLDTTHGTDFLSTSKPQTFLHHPSTNLVLSGAVGATNP